MGKARSSRRKREPGDGESPSSHDPARSRRLKYGVLPFVLAALGGVLAFVGFAGFGIWPLALVAFVPLFAALELARSSHAPSAPGTHRVVAIAWVFGFVTVTGGYWWIVDMLEKFSGFPVILNAFFASVLFLYIGGHFALLGWLWERATRRGWNATVAAIAACATLELVYPHLFPFYYGAGSLHRVSSLVQIADLGGPILVSALCLAVNGAVFELGRAWIRGAAWPRAAPAVVAATVVLTVVYGHIRIGQVDSRAAAAPELDVGVVQANMGIFAKRRKPGAGVRRHIEQTLALEEAHEPDLVVWPESAYTFFLPGDVDNVRRQVMGPVRTPLLFGGLARRREGGKVRHYNTAYLVDGKGRVQGTYDKTYLLAFGEYIPFGDVFPSLYDLSPNTGRFTPGDHVRPLVLDGMRFTTLVCYEDILPGFVRHAVRVGDPHLLVNLTNDAWFGKSREPWIHLALAKLRAVEHRRFLVRATNSGVSAVIDPAGRTVSHTGVFTQETLHERVALMQGWTPYQTLGNWPGWLGLGVIVWTAFVRSRSPRGGLRDHRPSGRGGNKSS